MKKIILTLLLIPILSILTLAQAISIPITISDNANHSQVLYFGLDPLATDGIDLSFSESDLPPPPVVGAFDARFVLPQGSFNGTLNSWRDYRGATLPFAGQKEHRLKYQRGLPGDSIFITYNLPLYISLNLKDVITGTIINVNLTGSGVYVVNNPDVFSQLKCFVNYTYKTLNLTALIEGFYDGTNMVSDTVKVELRNSTPPYSLVEQSKTVLNTTGNSSTLFYSATDATDYYIVLKHRNSIQTWSANPQQFSSGIFNYNFTTSQSQAFGNNMINVGGEWCIHSGDSNQDGIVDISDVGSVDNDNLNFVAGYTNTDMNGDNIVDISDVALTDANNLNFVSKITP